MNRLEQLLGRLRASGRVEEPIEPEEPAPSELDMEPVNIGFIDRYGPLSISVARSVGRKISEDPDLSQYVSVSSASIQRQDVAPEPANLMQRVMTEQGYPEVNHEGSDPSRWYGKQDEVYALTPSARESLRSRGFAPTDATEVLHDIDDAADKMAKVEQILVDKPEEAAYRKKTNAVNIGLADILFSDIKEKYGPETAQEDTQEDQEPTPVPEPDDPQRYRIGVFSSLGTDAQAVAGVMQSDIRRQMPDLVDRIEVISGAFDGSVANDSGSYSTMNRVLMRELGDSYDEQTHFHWPSVLSMPLDDFDSIYVLNHVAGMALSDRDIEFTEVADLLEDPDADVKLSNYGTVLAEIPDRNEHTTYVNENAIVILSPLIIDDLKQNHIYIFEDEKPASEPIEEPMGGLKRAGLIAAGALGLVTAGLLAYNFLVKNEAQTVPDPNQVSVPQQTQPQDELYRGEQVEEDRGPDIHPGIRDMLGPRPKKKR